MRKPAARRPANTDWETGWHQKYTDFIWSVADLLRGDRQSEYGKVVLPFTMLRRLDCVPIRLSG
ncbi:type I restriction-modification system subunit M N-terminal domain-containing protein [Rhizohabitans arisaemae]|uniref:type I restriction-modification system subunit M N-terminal domain-containing protein n=1 Tax=Rhizohabitans arisaemae TaxID=2720610 RepID=UPI0031FEA7C8